MKKRNLLTLTGLCLGLLYFGPPGASGDVCNRPSTAPPPAPLLDRIGAIYGPEVARAYQNVTGLPTLDLDSEPVVAIRYRRDDNPCNALFLKENPDMAEDCRKPLEKLTYTNRHGNRIYVHIKGGELMSIELRTSLHKKNPLCSRSVLLLNNALIVHDCLLARYSHNHAKILHFPGVIPSVAFDGAHNVYFRFGGEDYITFHADDFLKTEGRGLALRGETALYRNGTRAVPAIRYNGSKLYMETTNWSYPPLDGNFTLYEHAKKIGTIPATLLYKRLKNGRAHPRFKKEGLLTYLVRQMRSGAVKGERKDVLNRLVRLSMRE